MICKQFCFLHPVSCPGGLRHFHCSYLSFCHLDASRVRWLFATLLSAVIRLFFIADRKKQMPSSPDGGRGLEPTAPGSTLGHKWANSPLKEWSSFQRLFPWRKARLQCAPPQNAWMIFLLYLAFSKFSQIKLGPDKSDPEFNDITWYESNAIHRVQKHSQCAV